MDREFQQNQLVEPQMKKNRFGILVAMLGIAFFSASTYALVVQTQKAQIFDSYAAVHKATLSVLPASQGITQETPVQVWANVDTPMVFSRIELSFDPAVLQIKKEITPMAPSMANVIEKTTVEDANKTGTLVLVAAVDPEHMSEPPNGSFQIASFSVVPKSRSVHVQAAVSIVSTGVQLVTKDAGEFAVEVRDASYILNPSTVAAVGGNEVAMPTNAPVERAVPPVPSENTPVAVYEATPAVVAADAPSALVAKPAVDYPITIYAAGMSCGGVYPTMQLSVNNSAVAKWERVEGHPFLRKFSKYIYHSSIPVSPADVQIAFVNDDSCRNFLWGGRKLRVDRMEIGGDIYQSESKEANVISDAQSNKAAWMTRSKEWINNAGYLYFSVNQP